MKQGIVKSEGSNMRLGFSFLEGWEEEKENVLPRQILKKYVVLSSEGNIFEAFVYFWVLDLMIIPRGSQDSKFDPC